MKAANKPIGGMIYLLPPVLLALLALFQITTSPPAINYLGYSSLSWERQDGCQEAGGYLSLQPSEESVGTWISGGGENEGICESHWSKALSDVFEFTVGGYPETGENALVYLQIDFKKDQRTERLQIPAAPYGSGEKWRYARVHLPGIELGDEFRAKLVDRATPAQGGWIALRNRVAFFEYQDTPSSIRDLVRHRKAQRFLLVCLSVAIFTFILYIVCGFSNVSVFAISLVLLVFGVHFRKNLFFYWDEWHVVERFFLLGSAEVGKAHNEHFIPGFFNFLREEFRLFGGHYDLYIAFSLLLHTLNAFLLAGLLERIGSYHPHSRTTARMLACLFAVSSIACEVAQWGFLQSVLFGQFWILLGVITCWDFALRGGFIKLLLSLAVVFFGPLFFGGALLTPFLASALLILMMNPESAHGNGKRRRLVAIIGMFLAWAGIVVVYSMNQDGVGHGVDAANAKQMFEDPFAIINYALLGTFLGTFLGGIGIFPVVNVQPPNPILPPQLAFLAQNEFAFSLVGLGIGFCFLGTISWLVKRSGLHTKWDYRMHFAGLIMILMTMGLLAIGRARFGTGQAFSLRHQYMSIFWLYIFFFPLVSQFFTARAKGELLPHAKRKSAFWGCLIMAYLLLHLRHGQSFSYFVSNGLQNKSYVLQLTEWNDLLEKAQNTGHYNYQAHGSPYENQYPVIPQHLTPDMSPDQIYRVMHLLSPKEYKLRKEFPLMVNSIEREELITPESTTVEVPN